MNAVIIHLSPRESNCCICDKLIFEARHGIPFYEGEPVPNSWAGDWVGRDACEICFNEHKQWSERSAAK